MDLKHSYFSIASPFTFVKKWLYPYHRFARVSWRSKQITINITKRGERALIQRSKPLVIEMQLYLSCMVKKRVIFHDQVDFDLTKINDQLSLAFRTVVSTACDPIEFANNYPVKIELQTPMTKKLSPSLLEIDYYQNRWCGEYEI